METINSIWVSHRASRRVSGALHEDTVYGLAAPTTHTTPGDKPPRATGEAVVRKPLNQLSKNEVVRIRDVRIRTLVLARLAEHKVDLGNSEKIPPSVWTEPLRLIGTRAKTGSSPAIIHRVRILVADKTIKPISGRVGCVKPGNTHHIALFETIDAKTGKRRGIMVSVTMLDAVARNGGNGRVVSRQHPTDPQARFLFSLCRGDTIYGTIRGQTTVWVYVTSASTQGQIYFKPHSEAIRAKDRAVKANTLDGYKVVIDPIGRMRRGRD
jgi:CRISPR-associated endonuclease Csn1